MDPFIYQYAIGGTVFAVGLVYAYRQGYLGLSGSKARWTAVIVGGFLFFMGLQGYLQYAPMEEAAAVAYEGDGLKPGKLGTNLDYAVMVAYFVAMMGIGVWFGQGNKDTKDFFFGGQRFSWWLIAFSLIATTIGSSSFVKYSRIAYNYGIASSQTYLNDWFWMPLVLFGWLPILYFSRLTSIPEYFEHRFGRAARNIVTVLLLSYLIGYVGVNLFTMGKALHHLLGWPVFASSVLVASISAVYVTFGGQSSVIMTDLFQGVMLLATGLLILVMGAAYLGGFEPLWEHLPRSHRMAFPNFNEDPSYNAVGIFWQDGMANTAMFYFLNQGILMRFMAARSVDDGRKAAVTVLLVLMPVAAVVVASGGWVGRSLSHAGVLPPDMDGAKVFFITAEFLSMPGVFGLVMAALTAALMSTVDSLITAIAAIVVNDVYRPIRPESTEAELLKAARFSAIVVTLLGIALVPVFNSFDSIYSAHGAFTAAVTPPMVVALLFGVFWRRYTTPAALATMVGGSILIAASIVWPELITPFAHGVPMKEAGDGWLAGAKQYKFMRAFYGIAVSGGIGVIVTFATRPRELDEVRGYVWGTISDAIRNYKGSDGAEVYSQWARAAVEKGGADSVHPDSGVYFARISRGLASQVGASAGDLLYVSDSRAWLGGLNSTHVVVSEVTEDDRPSIQLGAVAYDAVVRPGRAELAVAVRRLY